METCSDASSNSLEIKPTANKQKMLYARASEQDELYAYCKLL